MLRRLLNIASVVCLVACVALMGMWAISSVCDESIHGSLTDPWATFKLRQYKVGFRSLCSQAINDRESAIGHRHRLTITSRTWENHRFITSTNYHPSNWRWSSLPGRDQSDNRISRF